MLKRAADLGVSLRLRLNGRLLAGNSIGAEKAFRRIQGRNRKKKAIETKKGKTNTYDLALQGRFASCEKLFITFDVNKNEDPAKYQHSETE